MRLSMVRSSLFVVLCGVLLGGCAHSSELAVRAESSDLLWTGVAQTQGGRVFVNYPRWFEDRYELAVGEVVDGSVRPFPDVRWNEWAAGLSWRDRFVAVQSVHIDRQDRLWVLDTGRVSEAEGRRAVVYEFDPATGRDVRTLALPFEIAPGGSYINDIRLTPDGRWAFISDSGLGAIIVLDTATGATRRVLDGHPSTSGDVGDVPVVEGIELRGPDGSPATIHADGIAVSPDGAWVYYQALTARTLYRVPVSVLTSGVSSAEIEAAVEDLGESVVTDAISFDDAGNLYFSALEEDAIIYRTPAGSYETLVRDPRIAWPDSFAIDRANGLLVFTTAQIHRSPMFSAAGAWPAEPFRVWTHPLAE